MSVLMTGLCEKGVDLIWKQCDESQFPRGLECLEQAVRAGDPEALFFLGYCYRWGDGSVGFNDKKAYECHRSGAEAGSVRCVLGALRAGQYDEDFKKAAVYSLAESYDALCKAAEKGDAFSAYQIAAALESEDLAPLLGEDGKAVNCLDWYERAARGGIVQAMVKAGKCYMEGRFTEADPDKMLYYADLAASCGNGWGLFQMGLYYETQEEPAAAFEYFKAATSQGDKKAPYHLGLMYLNGIGTERDVKKAVEALETAADREDTKCLSALGELFYRDELVERDNERAFFWYSRAYAVGDRGAALPLGHLYLSSWERQDYQKAEKFLKEAVDAETDGSVSLVLGNIYREGIGREPDLMTAISYYEAGGNKGNAECMEILGNLYFHGGEPDQSYEKAFYWLDKARLSGGLQSYFVLGFLYLKGHGCEPDEEQARELLEIATEGESDGYASYELGYLYERRNKTSEDLKLAAEYYQRAIELGNDSAARRFSHFKKNLFGKWKVSY